MISHHIHHVMLIKIISSSHHPVFSRWLTNHWLPTQLRSIGSPLNLPLPPTPALHCSSAKRRSNFRKWNRRPNLSGGGKTLNFWWASVSSVSSKIRGMSSGKSPNLVGTEYYRIRCSELQLLLGRILKPSLVDPNWPTLTENLGGWSNPCRVG